MQEGYWIEEKEQKGEKLLTRSEQVKNAKDLNDKMQRAKEYINSIKAQEKDIKHREESIMNEVKEIIS